jgi:DNA invertase Pin-like site-specific DNA recombinase
MKYVIYLRVSTQEQDHRTQEQKCLQFLKHQDANPFEYLIYKDKITSRKPLLKREGLQGALKSLRKGDILVAMRTDRLARNLHETTCIIHELEMKGADILLIDQPGIKNKVLLGLYAGMAEEEGKMIRKRIKDKLDVKRMRNERVSRYIPYGYKLDMESSVEVNTLNRKKVTKPGLLIEEFREQQVLTLMCRLFDQGYSFRNIALLLNKRGYLNRNEKPFQQMTIYRILLRTGRARSWGQPQEETVFELSHSTG